MGSDSKKYKASPDFILRKIAGANVLISVGGNIAHFNGYIEMNETAVLLWNMLQDSCDVQKLVCTLKEKYSLTDSQASQDVEEFLRELLEHDMVLEVA